MTPRRTRASLAVTTALAFTLLAGAQGSSIASPTFEPIQHRQFECGTTIWGADAANHFMYRTVVNSKVVDEERTGRPLPFNPRGFGFLSSKSLSNGDEWRFTTVRQSGHPLILTVRFIKGRKTSSFTTRGMVGMVLNPPLYVQRVSMSTCRPAAQSDASRSIRRARTSSSSASSAKSPTGSGM